MNTDQARALVAERQRELRQSAARAQRARQVVTAGARRPGLAGAGPAAARPAQAGGNAATCCDRQRNRPHPAGLT